MAQDYRHLCSTVKCPSHLPNKTRPCESITQNKEKQTLSSLCKMMLCAKTTTFIRCENKGISTLHTHLFSVHGKEQPANSKTRFSSPVVHCYFTCSCPCSLVCFDYEHFRALGSQHCQNSALPSNELVFPGSIVIKK